MSDLNMLQSLEEAGHLRLIQTELMAIDVEYLKECLQEMQRNQNFRESAMILDPNPFTANERADLNRAKLKQLELYIQAAENLQHIATAEVKLQQASATVRNLEKLF